MRRTEDLAPLPFREAVSVARLADGPVALSVRPDAAGSAALARFLGVDAIEDMAFVGEAAAEPDGARVEGRLTARIHQSCVVTLEPVLTALDLPVRRRYREGADPGPDAADGAVEIRAGGADGAMPDAAQDDGPDPLGAEIDLASLIVETLTLAIDPYPRAEGAALGTTLAGPPGVAPLTDEAARPFAALAALRAARPESED